MAVVRMSKDEVKLVLSATERRANRTNSRLVVNETRLEVADEEAPAERQHQNTDFQEVLNT